MKRNRALGVAAVTVAAAGGLLTLSTVTASAAPLPAGCTASATIVTCAFSYTGGEQTFVAPTGITSYDITAIGAAGGIPTGFGARAAGAVVTGTVTLTPGTTYYINVGGVGADTTGATNQPGGAGGYNGGGRGAAGDAGGSASAGGGGATSVQVASGECNLGGALVVAGGGGGSTGFNSTGGSAGLNGANGFSPFPAATGITAGGGGTQTAGGAAGTSGVGPAGPVQPGSSCRGGDSGVANPPAVSNTQRAGAGGGGGLFGGGGGGNGAGGGGGSSLVPAGGSVTTSTAAAALRIQYNDPAVGASAIDPVVGLACAAALGGAVLIVVSRRSRRVTLAVTEQGSP